MKLRLTVLCLGLLLGAGPGLASQTERQQIEAARQRIAQDFSAQEQACWQRFAVTDCVEDVRARRRQALVPWREKELALDAADRQRRADERRAAIQAKTKAAAEAPASAPPVVPRARKPGPTPTTVLPLAPPAADPARAAEAAARVQDAAKRKAEAEAAQARVVRRQAERSREGKAAAPLPVPAVGAASAAR